MNRTLLVMQALGWQGGTVHDLCTYLGLDVTLFLYGEPDSTFSASDYSKGLFINTCSMEHRHNVLVSKYKGSVDFWIGAARSQYLENKRVAG